jgi:hypothetical protein
MTIRHRKNSFKATSVRIERLDELEGVVRGFGFKDRTHFFQLAAQALMEVQRRGERLDWPPKFAVLED